MISPLPIDVIMGGVMGFAPRFLVVGATWMLVLGTAAPVLAQAAVDRATARQLGESGQQALVAKDYKTAEDDFRRADSLVHAPTLMLGLARALAGEGKLVEAQEAYRRILREGVAPGSPPVFRKAVDDATKEVDAVEARVGAVTITVKTAGGEPLPSNLQVTWDGAEVAGATLGVKRPADPGAHVVHAAAEGYASADLTVSVPAGGAVDAPLAITRTAAQPQAGATGDVLPAATGPSPDQATASASGRGPWPWVAFGVGGAGLVTGAVAGALVLSKHSDLAGKCAGGTCPPDQRSTVDGYNTLGTVSTIGFIVAGVGAAAGVTLLLLHPSAEPPARSSGIQVTPVLGPGSIGAIGRF
jgi:hypothetical protein